MKALILFISLTSFQLFANNSGTYYGEGTITYPNGETFPCMETFIKIRYSGSKLYFGHDYLLCDNLNFVIDDWENNYALKEDEIWIGDIAKVGMLEQDKISFSVEEQVYEVLTFSNNKKLNYKLFIENGTIVEFSLKK